MISVSQLISHSWRALTKNFFKMNPCKAIPLMLRSSLHCLPADTRSIKKALKRNKHGLTVHSIFRLFQFVTVGKEWFVQLVILTEIEIKFSLWLGVTIVVTTFPQHYRNISAWNEGNTVNESTFWCHLWSIWLNRHKAKWNPFVLYHKKMKKKSYGVIYTSILQWS